jgi:uncharacterized UPF0146 family protein|tara:strand:+ start:156 stop:1118 length:963 start_codon:yes stop_codon:yes gene_type:complete
MNIKKILNFFKIPLDILLSILIIPASFILYFFRYFGGHKFKLSKFVLKKIGIFPIIKNYYEPIFDFDELKNDLKTNRYLPGVNINIENQLHFLNKLKYANELKELKFSKNYKSENYYLDNNFFMGGDADIYYQMIRHFKPKKIVEIGSGFSSLVALEAIKKNLNIDGFKSVLKCIEPYENQWLEKRGIDVIRKKIEDVELELTMELNKDDILFVDTSHVIKPQGDLLKIFLEIFPKLKKGVIIHIHDIFTPKDYPPKWLKEENRFYNEQYLFEVLMDHSSRYNIICSLNHLKNDHYTKLKRVCPYLNENSEPSSIYIEVI